MTRYLHQAERLGYAEAVAGRWRLPRSGRRALLGPMVSDMGAWLRPVYFAPPLSRGLRGITPVKYNWI